jgi:hypothetical protein
MGNVRFLDLTWAGREPLDRLRLCPIIEFD